MLKNKNRDKIIAIAGHGPAIEQIHTLLKHPEEGVVVVDDVKTFKVTAPPVIEPLTILGTPPTGREKRRARRAQERKDKKRRKRL